MPDTHRLILTLTEALTSSLELTEILPRTYEILSERVAADYAALCISKPEQSAEYDWLVARMPPEFFARYAEMAPADFVRASVLRQPNVVLRDSEMVSREELVNNLMYRRCRELGMPLEHVMAVLLNVGLDWHGGFTLYRDRRRPFSDWERAVLQDLTPLLTNSVRNCRRLSALRRQGPQLVEALSRARGLGSIVIQLPASEEMRSERARALLEKWFAPVELGPQGLPTALWEHLAWLASFDGRLTPAKSTWTRTGPGQSLRVSFIPLPEQEGRRLWALLLEELSAGLPLPQGWRQRLTPREAQAVQGVLRYLENREIGEEMGCAEATVKKHLQRAYEKLGVENRGMLFTQASRH